jgi:tetratricopeptide (TPR) repeat protein
MKRKRMKIGMIAKVTIGLMILVSGPVNLAGSQTENRWRTWMDLRWQGLVEFSKGNLPEAKKSFEKALAEAKHVESENENTATSIYDVALVYAAEGNNRQAEDYCKEVLKLAQKVCPNSGIQTLAIISIQDIRAHEHDFDGVRKLDAEIIKLNREHPGTECIAQAEMLSNGDIEIRDFAEPIFPQLTHISSPDYKDLLIHIGPLRPKNPRPVAQWPENKAKCES